MKAVTLSAMLLSLWTCVWGRELLWVGGTNSDMCDAANWIDRLRVWPRRAELRQVRPTMIRLFLKMPNREP